MLFDINIANLDIAAIHTFNIGLAGKQANLEPRLTVKICLLQHVFERVCIPAR